MNAQPLFRTVALIALLAAVPIAALADDLKDGQKALQLGRLDEALTAFEKAAGQGFAAGRAGVGQVWLRRRQYDKAMVAFPTAQKMDPNLALAHWGQGEVLRRQEKCDQAIPLLVKANDLDRKFPDAKLALGDCYVKTKQFDKGVATLSEGLKWGPKVRPRFLVALGTAEMSRDSLRDAGIYFTTARQEAPTDPAVRKALGDFYVHRGTWALAITEHQAAVEMDTTDLELRFSLAQSLYYDQRYNEALDQYRTIIAKDPEFRAALLAMGNLLYLAGAADPKRYVEAREPLENYTRLEPNDGKGWSLLGRVYYNLRMRDEAMKSFDKAIALGDKSKDMYNDVMQIHAANRQWDQALAAAGKGNPGPKEQLVVGQIYVFKNMPAQADSVYQAIVAKDSLTTEARFALTEIGKLRFREAGEAARRGDEAAKTAGYQAAIATFQRRIALDPRSGEPYYYIGLSHKEMKQNAEAMAALEKAAALDSTKADRHFWLGVLYDAEKRQPDARTAFSRSVALDDTSKLAGKARRQLGFYQLLAKNWSGAIGDLERAVQLDDKDTQAWVWLAQGYQNSGNRTKALEAYRRALALDPNQADAKKGIQVLQGG